MAGRAGSAAAAALSLTVAAYECGGELPELEYLIQGDLELVLVVPLARESAAEVGGSGSLRGEDLEVAQVLWCATGHDDTAATAWPVATYWPDWYAGKGVPIIPL